MAPCSYCRNQDHRPARGSLLSLASVPSRISIGSRSKLPIEQPTKFTLAINAKTAKQLGISIPPALQVAADELIDLT